jgi:hypothetical protein
MAHDFDELDTGDRVLVIVPLTPLREGRDTFAAAADRFLPRG